MYRGRKGAADIEDKVLIEKVLRGDKSAFHPLVDRYSSLIYTAAVKIVRDPHIARDVAQEAFWQAYRSLEKFRGDSAFPSWLVRITVNKALDYKRRNKRDLLLADSLAASTQATAPGPEQKVLEKEAATELLTRMDSLPEVYCRMMRLHYIEHLPYSEIARREGISEKTVASRISRAKAMLRSKERRGDT